MQSNDCQSDLWKMIRKIHGIALKLQFPQIRQSPHWRQFLDLVVGQQQLRCVQRQWQGWGCQLTPAAIDGCAAAFALLRAFPVQSALASPFCDQPLRANALELVCGQSGKPSTCHPLGRMATGTAGLNWAFGKQLAKPLQVTVTDQRISGQMHILQEKTVDLMRFWLCLQ